ncbi:4Fe-4S dicluster domain-containing protein [candidate division KSB1 bacterium]|nr:4Fe-4S dicluster domain-containing protein [candidate division KSB1 bacterium]
MTKRQEFTKKKTILESLITLCFFCAIGVLLWRTQGHIFYLFNFLYIGFAASVGELLFGLLPREKRIWGRRISQFLIGFYMLGVLGVLGRENMQLEGFFFYLLAGVFSGPVLHYAIAKIFGTFLFGRGWCSWACWTTMLLDFFPWVKPHRGRFRYWGAMRTIHFFLSLVFVLSLWYVYEMRTFHQSPGTAIKWLLIGNLFYFASAIVLALVLKDNRAFCKYLCPIPVLMKIGSRFSIWKIELDPDRCTNCRLCEENCPMNIRLLEYMKRGQRVLSTECIACQQCVNSCPAGVIRYTKKFDWGWHEHLRFANEISNADRRTIPD